MAGPRYTIAQTRARVAAMEIAAQHLIEAMDLDEIDHAQFRDVALKLLNEAGRLKQKAQARRNHETYHRESRRRMPEACFNPLTQADEMGPPIKPASPSIPSSNQ